jgi:hypothetical protein
MAVQRIWRKHDVRPHRLERHMVSNDPDFEAKAAAVIGLYLNPPSHAAVFCVDEKTAIQALDRKDRTMGLVGLGSALIVVAAEPIGGNGDATRGVQGIVTGIGFLGAGVIFKDLSSDRIHRLTTAAPIWLAAALGMTCGLCYLGARVGGHVLSFVVLLFGGPIEKAIHRHWPHEPGDPETLP